MKKFFLNGTWKIESKGIKTEGEIPGSVYSAMLKNGLMQDPRYRDNELSALGITDDEFVFTRKFTYRKQAEKIALVCEGIDTLCDLYLNGRFVAHTDNMHRTYRFDVSGYLADGENEIKAVFPPLDEFIKKKYAEREICGCSNPMKGFMYVRKAHYMLGWDWGPRLPDAGIWRDIYLAEEDLPFITDFIIEQKHTGGRALLVPKVKTSAPCDTEIRLICPDGTVRSMENGKETAVEDPELWWPNGLGDQPLYTVTAQCVSDGKICDEQQKRIGLRSLKLIREKDEWGESFCHEINGVRFFAMGADYIPEDNILSACNGERTEKLLSDCVFANHNAIRVWGGGYYPDDRFFDICDELGLVVFFDLMFACTFYPFGEEFNNNALSEIDDNIKRIRHHACLGLISGNNEIEEKFCWYKNETVKKDYIAFFEKEIPALLGKIAPNIAYVPSSPSSFGGGVDPRNENVGDSHYWEVWHADKPFSEYRNHYFRYLSEFGFQSFPCKKTVDSFTAPEDRNIFSRVMELHQRNYGGNGKIMKYLSQYYLYPTEFETLLYASQLLQAEAIRYGAEHFRRNRGRCMGTLYWQLNDVWAGASWSSIDYFGRYKALHYASKRFYAPVAISCEETGEFSERFDVTNERCDGYETKAKLFVVNESKRRVCGNVVWKLCNSYGNVLKESKSELVVEPFSSANLPEIDFGKTDVNENYLWYEYETDGVVVSYGSVLFTKPKYFGFKDPELSVERVGNKLIVSSKAYARFVEIYSPDGDFVLSDNFFDMNKGEREVEIVRGEPKTLAVRSVYDIR